MDKLHLECVDYQCRRDWPGGVFVGCDMIITREWAMPNKQTFEILPISRLISRHLSGVSVDPFANRSKLTTFTNDLDPAFGTTHNMDALDFLRTFADASVDTALFDPPYTPRQVSECYKAFGRTVNMQTTQSSFWGNLKVEIARIVKTGGKVISCGYNSGGVGKSNGMELIEVLLVPHGGWHQDTIVTVEMKVQGSLI